MTKQERTCANCAAWSGTMPASDAECHRRAPTNEGWPIVKGYNWCLEWVQREPRSVADLQPETRREVPEPIGIHYGFVRDYPDRAAQWLSLATKDPEAIPELLRPVLADLFGAVLTKPLLTTPDLGVGSDELFLWAEAIPGFSNSAEGDPEEPQDGYKAVLMRMTPEEIEASREALHEIPDDHPWRML